VTIYTGWDVQIGGFDGTAAVTTSGTPTDADDFTSRVRSFTVDHQVALGRLGRSTAQVVLDNTDGALTPGGGGTYSARAWFSEPVFVLARAGTSDPPALVTTLLNLRAPFFAGPIIDVDFVDDGFDSTMTLTAADWITYVSRYTAQAGSTETAEVLTVFGNLASDVVRATFGADTTIPAWLSAGTGFEDVSLTVAAGDFLGDHYQMLAATEYGVIFPGNLVFAVSGSTKQVFYLATGIQRARLVPTTASPLWTMPDFDDADSLSTTELPYRNLRLGFDADELITQASITRSGGSSQHSYNDTNSQKFGPRSLSYSGLPLTDDDDASRMASFLTTRFAEAPLTVQGFEVTGSMIQQKANNSALAGVQTLMHAPSYAFGALWKPCTVKWTGAGSTTNDKDVGVSRVQVSAGPEDWTIRFHTFDAGTNMGFVLDSAQLGVLDQNRLN